MSSCQLRSVFALLVWSSSHLLLSMPSAAKATPAPQLAQATPASTEANLSPDQLQERAKAITVQIFPKDGVGSGIVIAQQGQTYIVLTNEHVVRRGAPYQIKTDDGKTHAATRIENISLTTSNLDLALLQFNASEAYPIAQLAPLSSVTEGDPVYAAGYPAEVELGAEPFNFEAGRVSLLLRQQSLKRGYRIGYVIDVDKGMSGGPILNGAGAVIGINGIRAQPNWGNPHVYEDGTSPDDVRLGEMRQASWGIPVETLAQFAPQYAQLPQANPAPTAASSADTQPVAAMAQNVTVALRRGNQLEGSGVIVDQVGSTYYVLTANHVLTGEASERDFYSDLSLIAPDGKAHPISAQAYTAFDGIDLALIKFTSDRNYEVAPLANYNTYGSEKTVVFISQWSETAGILQTNLRAGYLFGFAFNQIRRPDSLNSGYRLSYTNLTERKMSGSPIFDIAGRVIGIHAMAEGDNVQLETGGKQASSDLKLGYSMGIPVQTFLRGAAQKSIPLNHANNPENSVPLVRLNPEQKEQIVQASLRLARPADMDGEDAWLNYGNSLFRLFRYADAVAAFEHILKQNSNSHYAWYAKGLALKEWGLTLRSQPLLRQRISIFQDSQESFEAAVKLTDDPNVLYGKQLKIDAYRQLGDVRFYLRDFEGARSALESALNKINQDDIIAKLWLAPVFNELGLYPEALKTCTDVIDKDATVIESYMLRAQIYHFSINVSQAAIEDTSRVLKLQPDSAAAYQLRGMAKASLGDFTGAIADLNQAIELQPYYAAAYAGRGFVYASLGNRQQFEADFDQALRLEPDSPEHILLKAQAYNTFGDLKAASENFQQAIFLGSEIDFQYRTFRGMASIQNGNYDAAIQDFEAAIASEQEYSPAWMQRGLAYAQDRTKELSVREAEVKRSFDKAEELQPKNIWVDVSRGDAYFFLGNSSAGKAAYDRAIKRAQEISPPLVASIYNNRGLTRFQAADYAGAAEDFQEASKLQPQSYWPYSNLGDAYLKQGKTPEGRVAYDNALKHADPAIQDRIHNQLGNTFYSLKDYKSAVEEYDQAISKNPQNYQYYRNRGNAYYGQDQSLNASKDYSDALKYAPESVKHEIFNDLGNSQYGQGNYPKAIEEYTRAITAEPRKPIYYRNRGDAYFAMNAFGEGEFDYQKAVELAPEAAQHEYYNGLGVAQFKQQKYDEAVQSFTKAIALNPQPLYYNNRSDTYLLSGNKAKADADFSEVLRLAPEADLHQYYASRAARYYEFRRYPEAVAAYSEAIQRKPERDYYAYRGASRLQLDNNAEGEDDAQGIQDLEEAIKLAPDNLKFSYYNGRGEIRRRQGDLTGAIADFEQAISLNPGFIRSRLQRAVAKFNSPNPDYGAIEQELNKVVELDPENAESYFLRADFHLSRGDAPNPEAALSDLNKSIEINPSVAEAYAKRAAAKFRLSTPDYTGAEQDLNQAIALDQNSADFHFTLGYFHLNRKDAQNPQAAIQALDRAIELNPELAVAYHNRAQAKFGLKDFSGVISDATAALDRDLNPNDRAWSYFGRGLSYIQIGKTPEAIADLQEAERLFREQNNQGGATQAEAALNQLTQPRQGN